MTDALPTFTIPVAFSVNAIDEREAARQLVDILANKDLTNEWEGDRQIVESWWTPNHAWADGSDEDAPRLVFVGPFCATCDGDVERDHFLHRTTAAECAAEGGCAAPQDHHEFVPRPVTNGRA